MIDKIAGEGGLDQTMQETLEKAKTAVGDLSEKEQEAAQIAGLDLEDLKNANLELADILSVDVVNAQEEVLSRSQEELESIQSIRTEYQNWASDILNNVVPAYDGLITKINEAIKKVQELAVEQNRVVNIDTSGYISSVRPTGNRTVTGTNGGGSSGGNSLSKKENRNKKNTEATVEQGPLLGFIYPFGSSHGQGYKKGSIIRLDGATLYKYYDRINKGHGIDPEPSAGYGSYTVVRDWDSDYLKIKRGQKFWYIKKPSQKESHGVVTQFKTGGYTGTWGSDGRIAVLHQKELVLNAQDTENMLNAVQVLRTITKNLDDSFMNMLADIPDVSKLVTNKNQDLKQKVYIQASFPNVKDSNEIEKALNNLTNVASQRILTNKK